jgi:hypothetical protein
MDTDHCIMNIQIMPFFVNVMLLAKLIKNYTY